MEVKRRLNALRRAKPQMNAVEVYLAQLDEWLASPDAYVSAWRPLHGGIGYGRTGSAGGWLGQPVVSSVSRSSSDSSVRIPPDAEILLENRSHSDAITLLEPHAPELVHACILFPLGPIPCVVLVGLGQYKCLNPLFQLRFHYVLARSQSIFRIDLWINTVLLLFSCLPANVVMCLPY